jgi:hypothetical protein
LTKQLVFPFQATKAHKGSSDITTLNLNLDVDGSE